MVCVCVSEDGACVWERQGWVGGWVPILMIEEQKKPLTGENRVNVGTLHSVFRVYFGVIQVTC